MTSDPMLLAIRSALPEDEAEVVRLWHDCGLVVSYNDPGRDFRFARSGDSSDVLVGEDHAGRIIGTAMVGHDGHRGWLYYLACAADRRGTGIGREMVAAAEAWLRARKVAKMQLMIREANTQIVPFYERLGFELMPRVMMAKFLPGPADDEG